MIGFGHRTFAEIEPGEAREVRSVVGLLASYGLDDPFVEVMIDGECAHGWLGPKGLNDPATFVHYGVLG